MPVVATVVVVVVIVVVVDGRESGAMVAGSAAIVQIPCACQSHLLLSK